MGLIADIHNDLEKSALQLIVEYRERLLGVAVGLCKDESLAEDLVFRTFERVVSKADRCNSVSNLFAWMKSILENIYKNDMKRPVVRGTKAVDADELERCAGADWSTDEQILNRSDSEAIRKALSGLDPKYHQVVLMRYYDEFSLKQIANVMRLPIGTVSRRLHFAHRMLAGKLRNELGRAKKSLAVLAAVLAFSFLSIAAVVTVPSLAPVRDAVAGWFAGDGGTGVPPVQEDSGGDGGTGVPPVQEDSGGTGIPPVQEETVSKPKQEATTPTQPNTADTKKEGIMNIKKIAAAALAATTTVAVVPETLAEGQVPGDIYQESLSATIDNPQDWLVKESGVHRAPISGDRMYIGTQTGNYLLQMSGLNCRLENLNEFAGVGAEQVTARVEIANGACLSVTNGFTLGAKEAGQKARAELLISGGKLAVKGVKFSGTNSNGKGNDSSVSVLIENGGELNLEAVTSSCIASLQLTGKEPVDFTVSTGGVFRANFASGNHYISAWKETNNPGQKYRDAGPGANVTFTVDGGLVSATNTSFYMQSSTIRMKSGSWCAKELSTTEAQTCGKLEMTGGDVTLSGDICLWNGASLADDFVLSGGTATVNRITCQSSVRVVKVSGGKLVLNGTVAFDNASGGCSAGRLWFHVYGSTADIAVPGVGAPRYDASHPISIPTSAFWDYRFDSTALPGGPGVAPCKKNLANTTVHGNYRISPYGGFQLVSTNVFPLVVHTSGSTLTTNTTYGTLLNTCHHTDLWDYALSGSTFAATLKEEAALVDGRTYAEGRVRGYLQLPRIGNPKGCLGATVRMNIVPQGEKTLDDIVSNIAGQYPGTAKVSDRNYNVEIPLPLERLGRGESNRIVFDFSDVTSFANAQNGVVTTNALVTAITAKVKRPGLIMCVY